MTDRRVHPGNGSFVLAGYTPNGPERSVAGTPARLMQDAWLLPAPAAPRRDRQLLTGNAVSVIEQRQDQAFVRSEKDGYCGWIPAHSLGPDFQPTDRVIVRTTHVYPAPSMKEPASATLHFGAEVLVRGVSDGWAELGSGGFVPASHVSAAPKCSVADAGSFMLGAG